MTRRSWGVLKRNTGIQGFLNVVSELFEVKTGHLVFGDAKHTVSEIFEFKTEHHVFGDTKHIVRDLVLEAKSSVFGVGAQSSIL